MAYDGTSLYGDIICDDYYDLQNNLMNPPSDVGFFFYKIVGGAFDRMSEICSNFLNDCDVLTCVLVAREYGARVSDFRSKSVSTDYVVTTDYESFDHYKYDKSSDSFVFVETTDNAFITRTKLDTRWGKEYDLPRPLLYEGQKADYLFVDNGKIASHNDHWYTNSYGTATVQDDGTKLLNTSGNLNFVMRSIIPSDKTITEPNAYSYNPPYIVEFDIVETDGAPSSNAQVQIYSNETQWNFTQGLSTGHWRIKVTSDEQKIWVDDTLIKTTKLSLPNARITLRVRQGKYLIYRNFKVYTGEDKERYLTDDEYRVYLYCNMCRLLTMEDIRRVFEHCFNTENNSISISEVPSNIFTLTDKVRNNQNLAGTTDYLRDAGDTHLVNKYSVNVNSFTEIRIPSQGWDSEFLELIKESASLKGNVLIREVSE